MQIDTNTLLYVLFAVLGVGYRLFSRWMSEVDDRLDKLTEQKLDFSNTFLTKADHEQSKEHVWDKLNDHDERIRKLELMR